MLFLRTLKRSQIPAHLLGHPVEYTRNLISEEHGLELKKLVLEMKVYPSNINADTLTGGWKVRYPHIGEAVATKRTVDETTGNITVKCDHEFMTPNADKTMCILPQRIDIGKHFIMSGGVDGQRENYQSSLQRVTSFGRYYMGTHGLDTRLPPLVTELFEQPKFQQAAKNICPADKQLLDPFQFNIIMQVPGQTVASHIDAPYFWGADRLDFPQWLLATMVFSNLFSEQFIHQVQVVGYLSDIAPKGTTQEELEKIGGEFIYYQQNDEGRYAKEHAEYLAGSCVDGSKLVHASRIYRPNEQVPFLDKDKHSELVYVDNEKWELRVDEKVVKEYHSKELRTSVVYRARCFKDEEELQRYRTFPVGNRMDLMSVLDKLIEGMVDAKAITRDAAYSMSKVDLAMMFLQFYVKYPLPSAEHAPYIPWNYCLASKLYPILGELC
jgi:hypothetical protein